MSCQCNEELKRNENVIKIYDNLTKQLSEQTLNDFQISYKDLLQISVAYTTTNEADLIVKPIIKAIKDYDPSFNQNFTTANQQIDGIAKQETQALTIFKNATNDVNNNIQKIQKQTSNANTELNQLREKTTKEISKINTQINQVETNEKNLQNQMKRLQDEINALQRHLNNLKWAWIACVIPIFCGWVPKLIQEVGFKKSQREAELRDKVKQLNTATTELGLLKNQHKNLTNQLNANKITLATIQNSNNLCIFMLNNLINISQALSDIDVNETPLLLKRLLVVLKQSWDELMAKVSLLAASLNIN